MKFTKKINFNEIKKYLLEEILSLGVGWMGGLLAVQLMISFFEKRGFGNLWGLWSDKIVIEESSFDVFEWIMACIIGFIIMKLVNRVMKLVLKINNTNS